MAEEPSAIIRLGSDWSDQRKPKAPPVRDEMMSLHGLPENTLSVMTYLVEDRCGDPAEPALAAASAAARLARPASLPSGPGRTRSTVRSGRTRHTLHVDRRAVEQSSMPRSRLLPTQPSRCHPVSVFSRPDEKRWRYRTATPTRELWPSQGRTTSTAANR